MTEQKNADCYKQSAGLDCPARGHSWPMSILSQGDFSVKVGLSASTLGAAGKPVGGDVPTLVDCRQPPSGNTGVTDTCSVDWISATLPGDFSSSLQVVSDLFGAVTPLDYGFRGYSRSGVVLCTGRVAWSPARPDMGVHVDLPSSALSELHRVTSDLVGLLRCMCDLGFSFTRLDVAADDLDGILDLGEIRDCIERGDYTSRWHTATRMYNLRGAGSTIYLGAPSSDSMLRIYDKAAERGTTGPWVRVEFQARRRVAHALVLGLVERGLSAALAIVRSYVDFKVGSGDSNVSRRRTALWWVRFLRGLAALRLRLPSITRTLDGVRRWLTDQVAPSLALVVEADGGVLDWLIDLVDGGKRRLTPVHFALLPQGVGNGRR